MFTNSEMLKSIIEAKGLSIYKIYLKMGKKRNVYQAFEENMFTERFIKKLEKIVGEDLSMFVNIKD